MASPVPGWVPRGVTGGASPYSPRGHRQIPPQRAACWGPRAPGHRGWGGFVRRQGLRPALGSLAAGTMAVVRQLGPGRVTPTAGTLVRGGATGVRPLGTLDLLRAYCVKAPRQTGWLTRCWSSREDGLPGSRPGPHSNARWPLAVAWGINGAWPVPVRRACRGREPVDTWSHGVTKAGVNQSEPINQSRGQSISQ